MAKTDAVWGIDIGNCSLKALRLRPADEPNRVIAEAFDYIEYPKILTQPGAEPAELIADALGEFLSRNSVRGDRVAISVSGQSGLARFIKLPPVESRKIPDIIRYEARQQIPFDLNDVIWDYQRMGGGSEEGGFVLETEVGLFAMKRDQVFRALEPFERAGIDVDVIQLTPLSLYNFACFDQLQDIPPPDEYDPDNPPPSTVILSMGTDASDLVITNGYRVWQRSIPLGGNHFTKALTKELKLTFAKAEHLKRNAATAEDPKAVFQAMRSVFSDLLTEIQRSIGYFSTLDRAAKIERVLALGNGIKLPGLRRYLAQSLGMEVGRLESYRSLAGSEVLSAPAFQENLACFPVSYGLALQGLKKGLLRTNLLPKEIVKDRLIDAKKPWAVACAAVLLLACALSFVGYSRAWSTVRESRFQDAEQKASSVSRYAKDVKQQADEVQTRFDATKKIGINVVESIEGRQRWLEFLKAVNECLPKDLGPVPEEIDQRNQVHVLSIDCQRMESFDAWFAMRKQQDFLELSPEEQAAAQAAGGGAADSGGGAAAPAATGTAATGQAGTAASPAPAGSTTGTGSPDAPTGTPASASAGVSGAEGVKGGPVGPGWLVEIRGYHYHNADPTNMAATYVRNTLIKNLQSGQVPIPSGIPDPEIELVSMKDLGIGFAALVDPGRPQTVYVQNPYAALEPGDYTTSGGTSPDGPGIASSRPVMPGSMGRGTSYPSGSGMRPPTMGSGSGAVPSMRGPVMSGMGSGAMMPMAGASMAGMRPTGSGMSPMASPMGARGLPGTTRSPAGGAGGGNDGRIELQQFDFTIEFVWQPTTPTERLEKKKKAQTGETASKTQAGAPGPAPAEPSPAPAAPGPAPASGQPPVPGGAAPTPGPAAQGGASAPSQPAPSQPAASPPAPSGPAAAGETSVSGPPGSAKQPTKGQP